MQFLVGRMENSSIYGNDRHIRHARINSMPKGGRTIRAGPCGKLVCSCLGAGQGITSAFVSRPKPNGGF